LTLLATNFIIEIFYLHIISYYIATITLEIKYRSKEITLHIYILGICGTFMGGIALLAREAGHQVSGSDTNVYPPMSTQLEEQGIELNEGYDPSHLDCNPDCVVIGNVMSRGNSIVEEVLNRGIPYTSGPEWLASHLLKDRWVLAVSGTHGKTTTASMLAWILDYAGKAPGFLIGGVPENFGKSARFGSEPYFVVEADEYDTAFFDKRSKFVHYHPRTLVINNLEFDHADIFSNLDDIKRQFNHLIRTVPGQGCIIFNNGEPNVLDLLAMGRWSEEQSFTEQEDQKADWQVNCKRADGSSFEVIFKNDHLGTLTWSLIGMHNVQNALAAIAAAHHVGVSVTQAIQALECFKNVKRRLELRGEKRGIKVFDDFAHHPTAITSTLDGLRKNAGSTARIFALLEPRSNTMRMGVHKDALANSLTEADQVLLFNPSELDWDLKAAVSSLEQVQVLSSVDEIVSFVKAEAKSGDIVLVMSNGAFGGIHEKLLDAL